MREPKTWLLVDVPFLAWRGYHSVRGLNFDGQPTDVLYSVFRDIRLLQERHFTKHIAFTFDRRPYERSKVYPEYKRKNSDLPEEEIIKQSAVRKQINLLRRQLLPDLGYRNVFSQKGYESDDLLASLVRNSLGKRDSAIVVSSDQDLYQLLCSRVVLWNPDTRKKAAPSTSIDDLIVKYHGITPDLWPQVKAIAGCGSDNIKGITGVGEITACKYLTKKLKTESKAYWAIVNGQEIVKRNLPLVTLPWPGVKTFDLVDDETSQLKWRQVCKKLGFKSLVTSF